MDKSQILPVSTEADVILARLQVRNLARESGFNIMDQARIALATSSLAHALNLGGSNKGRIMIGNIQNDHQACGVQVICEITSGATCDKHPKNLGEVKIIVDQLTVEPLSPKGFQVTLIKWRA
jgi:serine/threonine-protein kinase RsbT